MIKIRAKFGNEVIGMGVDMNAAANTFAKKEKAKKRFQDKTTRKALVAFVASGTHREVVVKKTSKKIKSGKFFKTCLVIVVDLFGILNNLFYHYFTF